MESKIEKTGVYSKVSDLVNDWLQIHAGENFDLDTICRQLEIRERENRKYVAIELARKVSQKKLRKNNKLYVYINKEVEPIHWETANPEDKLDLSFPKGRDGTGFSFDGAIEIFPRDLIVIAGQSNYGKTGFVLNLVVENMGKYHCRLMGNEYDERQFAARMQRFDWVDLFKEDGQPKFETIRRFEGHQDIILPDAVNVIDWLNLQGDKTYLISNVLQDIKASLNRGIAVVVIQKAEDKKLGRGGSFSQELASIYLTLDYQRLTVVKAKAWNHLNPNGKMYGFNLGDRGTKFNNIHEVKLCPKCQGYCVSRKTKCLNCQNTGYVSLEEEGF